MTAPIRSMGIVTYQAPCDNAGWYGIVTLDVLSFYVLRLMK